MWKLKKQIKLVVLMNSLNQTSYFSPVLQNAQIGQDIMQVKATDENDFEVNAIDVSIDMEIIQLWIQLQRKVTIISFGHIALCLFLFFHPVSVLYLFLPTLILNIFYRRMDRGEWEELLRKSKWLTRHHWYIQSTQEWKTANVFQKTYKQSTLQCLEKLVL